MFYEGEECGSRGGRYVCDIVEGMCVVPKELRVIEMYVVQLVAYGEYIIVGQDRGGCGGFCLER
jgi:hypothetical protein